MQISTRCVHRSQRNQDSKLKELSLAILTGWLRDVNSQQSTEQSIRVFVLYFFYFFFNCDSLQPRGAWVYSRKCKRKNVGLIGPVVCDISHGQIDTWMRTHDQMLDPLEVHASRRWWWLQWCIACLVSNLIAVIHCGIFCMPSMHNSLSDSLHRACSIPTQPDTRPFAALPSQIWQIHFFEGHWVCFEVSVFRWHFVGFWQLRFH